VLCSGVLSQTADTTVKMWSMLLSQLLSLAARLAVADYVASATLETSTGKSFKEEVQGS
jgi:hypothetical protein